MFSLVHIHLLLNHVPIIFTALGTLFALVALIRSRAEISRWAAGFFVGAATFAVPTYFTGEPAEDAVEQLPGVTRALIHEHEAAAFYAIVVSGILGVIALWALWKYRRQATFPRWVQYVLLLAGIFGSSVFLRTGLLGGKIRHTEVRSQP